MSTNFPTSLDSFTGPAFGSLAGSDFIINLAQAVNALQTKVGVDGSAVQTSLDYRNRSGPGASGFLGWSFDPAASANAVTITTTSPNVYNMVAYLPASTVTNLHCYISSGAATTHFAMALYNTAGTLLSQTADKTSDGSATGLKTYALGAPQAITAGFYGIALAITGASPSFFAGAGTTAAIFSGIGAQPVPMTARCTTSSTAYTTTMPSPLGTLSGSAGKMLWVAAS